MYYHQQKSIFKFYLKKPIKMLFSRKGLGMASEGYFPVSGWGLVGTEWKSLA